tara:strand:- start:6898 stop:7122 length:225 start_codon:yes stop_codon:yes gene_type:complete
MVLSSSSRASRIASIANQDSQGGSKKSGLAPTVGKDSFATIFVQGRAGNVLDTTLHDPAVRQSRPIGVSAMIWR